MTFSLCHEPGGGFSSTTLGGDILSPGSLTKSPHAKRGASPTVRAGSYDVSYM
jgi:hypothetical protein